MSPATPDAGGMGAPELLALPWWREHAFGSLLFWWAGHGSGSAMAALIFSVVVLALWIATHEEDPPEHDHDRAGFRW